MTVFSTYSRLCPENGARVRLDQSEAQCRAQHGCEQHYCPMSRDFSPESIDFLLAASRALDN